MITNVDRINNMFFKREDLFEYYGLFGGKYRILSTILKDKESVVTCGSRESIQVLSVANLAKKLGIRCDVFIPQGKDTNMITELYKTNSRIHRVFPAYNTVLTARAREFSNINNLFFLEMGMPYEDVFNIIGEQVINIPNEVNRIFVPVGSGTTLIGVVKGLKKYNIDKEVIGVSVGMNPKKLLDKFIEPTDYTIIVSDKKYKTRIKLDIPISLNPTYESKCIEHMGHNDMLWVVSR